MKDIRCTRGTGTTHCDVLLGETVQIEDNITGYKSGLRVRRALGLPFLGSPCNARSRGPAYA
ncbi:hypothetical protein DEDE109153_06110 [Deinococcus deserti]